MGDSIVTLTVPQNRSKVRRASIIHIAVIHWVSSRDLCFTPPKSNRHTGPNRFPGNSPGQPAIQQSHSSRPISPDAELYLGAFWILSEVLLNVQALDQH